MTPDIGISDIRSPEGIERSITRALCGGAPDVARLWTEADLWDRCACVACDLGVGGMLDERLIEQGVSRPASAKRIFSGYREHLRAAGEHIERCLVPVVDSLNHHAIPFLLMKGMALRACLYPKRDLRPMGDVDMLIHERDWPRVRRVFHSIGLRPQADMVHPEYFPRFYYECPFVTSDVPAVRLDLHVRPFRPILYRDQVPGQAMWLMPRSFELLGRMVRTPGLDETFIHLCVHGAVHGLSGLRWLYDIFLMVERDGDRLDAFRIASWVESWGLSWPMLRALDRVMEVFAGAEQTNAAPVLTRLKALRDRLSRRVHWKERLALWQAPRDVAHPVRHVLVNALCLPTWRDRRDYLNMHFQRPRRAGSFHRGSVWSLALARRLRRGLLKG